MHYQRWRRHGDPLFQFQGPVTKTHCSIPGCDKVGRVIRGWCTMHYARWQDHGDPMGPTVVSIEDRFWANVERRGPGECWPWTGDADGHGYGRITVGGKRARASRMLWSLAHGPVPDDLHVLHHCDNPPCVNPAHLFLGDHRDNMADRDAKDRVRHGSLHPRAKLTETDIPVIRARVAAGDTRRAIAADYGVSHAAIDKVASGQGWKRVA
jgi:hypothetical protein